MTSRLVLSLLSLMAWFTRTSSNSILVRIKMNLCVKITKSIHIPKSPFRPQASCLLPIPSPFFGCNLSIRRLKEDRLIKMQVLIPACIFLVVTGADIPLQKLVPDLNLKLLFIFRLRSLRTTFLSHKPLVMQTKSIQNLLSLYFIASFLCQSCAHRTNLSEELRANFTKHLANVDPSLRKRFSPLCNR